MKIALCKSSEAVPEGEFLYERKFDGARAVAMDGDLYNRDGDEVGRKITQKFPEIDPPRGMVLDGEIVSPSGFGSVVGRQNDESEFSLRMKAKTCPATYKVFDLLAVEDEDLRDRPLIDRKARLHFWFDQVGMENERRRIEAAEPRYAGKPFLKESAERGWEGIVAKRMDSPYPKGRSSDWLKIKNFEEGVFPIVKWEETAEGGFVVHIPVEDGTQRIVVNDRQMQRRIRESGEDLRAEIRYLEKGENSRLRHIALERVVRG